MADKRPVSQETPGDPAEVKASADTKAAGDKTNGSRAGLAKTVRDIFTIPPSATPYFIAALLAAVAMGWYFFVFVPQKLEYFVGLRFRTLAVASGQIKGKAESLGRSLSSVPVAPEPEPSINPAGAKTAVEAEKKGDKGAANNKEDTDENREKDTARYLRLLVPDIQLENPNSSARLPGLQLDRLDPKEPEKTLRTTVAWERVASLAAAASAPEFDDLVLADAQGEVVWQREKTSPRLGNLSELLYSEDDKGTLMSPSWAIRTAFPVVDAKKELPKTAALKAVRIGTTSTLMLVQAVHLESPYVTDASRKTLYVAGFVSRGRLQQQAMRIPLTWLVVVWLPIAVLFLVLPFIKLATINAKERFSLVNLILMAVGTVAAAGLGAVIPLGPRAVSNAGDEVLASVADLIETRLAQETEAVVSLARDVVKLADRTSQLKTCEVRLNVKRWSTDDLCDLWEPMQSSLNNDIVPELDVVIWLNDRAEQVRKWTTKAQLTGEASHRGFSHFQDLIAGNLWSLKGEPEKHPEQFTIESLRAPTTADLGVMFAMPLKSILRSAHNPPGHGVGDAQFLALNVRPHAVVDAVMPPGYGFAIVASDGRVLFHSNEGLSLEENFFEEVSDAPGVRERMQMGRPVTWSGDYHGVPHRIHMQPVNKLQGCPWKIVTFQDLSPGLAAIVEHQSGTLRLSLLNVLLLLAVIGFLAWWYTRSHGRDIRDLITAPVSPDPVRLLWLTPLTVIGVVVVFAVGLPSAHRWTTYSYSFFVALPFAAVFVSISARWRDGFVSIRRRLRSLVRLEQKLALSDATRRRERKILRTCGGWVTRSELALLVVLVGALPAAGFARIVQQVQDVQATERWLEVAHQRTVAHADRARARANSPGYTEARRALLVNHASFQGGTSPPALHYYVSGSPVSAQTPSNEACTDAPETGQIPVRRLLSWTLFASDRRGVAEVKACAGSNRLQITGNGISLAAMVGADSKVRSAGVGQVGEPPASDLVWEQWVLALVILGGTILVAYWAMKRLTTPRTVAVSTLEEVLNLTAADGNQGIMLVGPPRTRKDCLVKDAVLKYAYPKREAKAVDPIYRIKLLEAAIDAEFLKCLDKVSELLKERGTLDSKNRLWIHVSNLETQLITAERRAAVLGLLEKLLERSPGEPSRVIVVTTSIDPIAHFHEIFTQEREGIYDNDSPDDVPEVELSRSSLVLSRFQRCYLPIKTSPLPDPWWNYDRTKWPSTLDWEAAHYPPLVEVANSVRQAFSRGGTPHKSVSRGQLARTFLSQALASYDLLWASCTRCEKIVLIQLAQEGFVTTQNCEIVWGLIHKGLIVARPRPTIFNNSFRLFLRSIEHDHVVEQWEREDGTGLWLVAGRLIGSSLIAGGLFYLTTQDFSVDSLLPVVSGTGVFGVPMLRALLARVTMRSAGVIAG